MKKTLFALIVFVAGAAAAAGESLSAIDAALGEVSSAATENESSAGAEPAADAEQPAPAAPAETKPSDGQTKKKAKMQPGRPAKIKADTTVYNRKEGVASFVGHVHVDDEQYQMHADHVYLFLEGTNDLRRIVAIGNVAMTNEARRAYGAKATYSKKNGLVVLYSGDGIVAEVRDESKGQERTVRGKRIRFWIDAEQVEVDEADLTGAAPAGGTDSLKKAFGK